MTWMQSVGGGAGHNHGEEVDQNISVGDLFGGRYLRGADIGDRELQLTVASVRAERVKVGESMQIKPVLQFHEHQKSFVVRGVEVETFFVELLGTGTVRDWDSAVRQTPLPIVLYTVPTNLGPGIRVKRGTVQQQPQQPPQPMQQPQQPMQPGGYQQQQPQQPGGYQQQPQQPMQPGYQQLPQPGGYQQTMPRGHWWPPSEQQAPEPPPHPPTF